MTIQWISAAIVSSALIAGCGDRGNQNTTKSDENPATSSSNGPDTSRDGQTGAAEAVSPDADRFAPRAEDSGTKPTTGTRSSTDANRPPTSSGADTNALPRDRSASRPSTANRENAAAPRGPAYREVTVPAGTALPLELATPLSSETAQVETPVQARLRQAVIVDGATVLPAGAVFSGNVTTVDDAGRVHGRATLAFRFTEVEVRGSREDLRTNPISFQAEGSKREDATKIGAGAVGGAIIGGILGGGKGAAKGAAVGGAAGTGVVLATKGKDVNLAVGTDIAATLADPFTARVPIR